MQLPLSISFRNMHPTESLEAKVREKAAKLERFFDHITRCDVVIETPHHDHRKGRLYHVRIDMTVPGGELVVRGDQSHANEDPYIAVRDAFAVAKRQLEDWLARKRDIVPEPAV